MYALTLIERMRKRVAFILNNRSKSAGRFAHHRIGRMVALVGVVAAIAAPVAACGGIGSQTPGKQHEVVMKMTGDPDTADITYGTGADQSQATGAALPWSKTVKADDPVVAVLSGQSGGTGKITCQISIDGKVVKTNTAEGEFAVVTCSS